MLFLPTGDKSPAASGEDRKANGWPATQKHTCRARHRFAEPDGVRLYGAQKYG